MRCSPIALLVVLPLALSTTGCRAGMDVAGAVFQVAAVSAVVASAAIQAEEDHAAHQRFVRARERAEDDHLRAEAAEARADAAEQDAARARAEAAAARAEVRKRPAPATTVIVVTPDAPPSPCVGDGCVNGME